MDEETARKVAPNFKNTLDLGIATMLVQVAYQDLKNKQIVEVEKMDDKELDQLMQAMILEKERRIEELKSQLKDSSPRGVVSFENLPLDERILRVLREMGVFLTPRDIAHRVGFLKPNNQAYRVNGTLYDLLDRGEIEKTCGHNGAKPMYKSVKK